MFGRSKSEGVYEKLYKQQLVVLGAFEKIMIALVKEIMSKDMTIDKLKNKISDREGLNVLLTNRENDRKKTNI